MKKVTSVVCLVALIVLAVQSGLGWGNATHVYFAKHLGAKFGFTNMHEMYGALVPDTYNLVFDANGQYLYNALHTDFMPLYVNATTREQKSLAFGFVTHNGLWGADYTAHYKGFTTPGGGYAVVKGVALSPQLIPALVTILTKANVPPDMAQGIAAALAPEMGHDLCETAVDILVRRNLDPLVGVRMAAAARSRPNSVGDLLAGTYADALVAATGIDKTQAVGLITQVEAGYAEQMTQYGLAFSLPEQQTLALLSEQIAAVAVDFIKANVGVTVEIEPSLVADFLAKAIALVRPDYLRELSRTMAMVEVELKKHGIAAPLGILAAEMQTTEALDAQSLPVAFELKPNFPNPFNPSTTIGYALPADCHVSLKVFNTLGEEVAILVNGAQMAGHHSVVWNAAAAPSGVYFYRIDAGDVVQTRKMTLTK